VDLFSRILDACFPRAVFAVFPVFFFWLVAPEEIAESTVFDWVLALFEVG
jgi:hypothetical protein